MVQLLWKAGSSFPGEARTSTDQLSPLGVPEGKESALCRTCYTHGHCGRGGTHPVYIGTVGMSDSFRYSPYMYSGTWM